MSKIELVLTDFDGTVVEFGRHVVSDTVREAVIACENRGVRVVPVTGRYHAMAQPVLELLGFEDLGVFDNGATIQNCKTGEVVLSAWLEVGLTKQVASIVAPAATLIDYEPDHTVHQPADNELERIEQVVQPTSHIYAEIPSEAIAEITSQLDGVEGISYYWAASTRGHDDCRGVQVTCADADKFYGVNALRQIIDVPKEATLAIGDGDNDIALFANAGLRVAMGNATPGLKAAADHVVDDVEHDGFADAMHQFVLGS